MAKLPSQFRADEHDEMNDYTPIPADVYHCKIKDSDLVENSQKTGSFLKMVFEVASGEYKGRLLFTNMNLIHPNKQAVEIAEKEFAAICRAAGKITVEDSEELHGKELNVKVVIKPATANYPAGNECKNYSEVEGLAKPSASSFASEPKKQKKVSFD
jgi:hypothetical protein